MCSSKKVKGALKPQFKPANPFKTPAPPGLPNLPGIYNFSEPFTKELRDKSKAISDEVGTPDPLPDAPGINDTDNRVDRFAADAVSPDISTLRLRRNNRSNIFARGSYGSSDIGTGRPTLLTGSK